MSEETVMQNATSVDPMAAAIRRTAQEVVTISEAEQRLAIRDLPAMLAENKDLATAWERGRMLRRLGELAEGPICEKVVAQRLGLADEMVLRSRLESDPEAGDIWRQGRHSFFMRAKRAIMEGVEAGKPQCLRLVEGIIRADSGQTATSAAVDFRAMTPTQLESATGIRRMQLARWTHKHALPVNADGTYSLPAFVAWLRKSPRGRTRQYKRGVGAVEKRIIARCAAIVREELNRNRDSEPDEQ